MKRPITPNDTIVAISTPIGEGGIGIIRLSGSAALSVADKIFKSSDGNLPSGFKGFTTHYGHIVDKTATVDEVILTVMRKPKSFTKEDVVEINCHGGIVPLKKVLEMVLLSGVRMAEPGEFTKRAFLNGRIDLAQAESVLDVIRSKTDTSLRSAISQLRGDFSESIKDIRSELVDLLADVEASIDFPEEETGVLSIKDIISRVKKTAGDIQSFIDSAQKGKILTEGIRTVICGRPNVGKSSLMNYLLREKRVIVSHIPGTTRDAIEEIINIDGIPLKIIDTAGISQRADTLTKEGIERSRLHIKSADLVLFLLDGSEPLNENDRDIIEEIKDKKVIVVINKTDLPKRLENNAIKKALRDKKIIEISVVRKKNLKKLEDAISDIVWGGHVTSDHTRLVTNVRHKALLIEAKDALFMIIGSKGEMMPEFIALDLKEAIDRLGEITGETIDGELLDKIFSKFCIGK
ncbi:MAG: tRNA uridine-5-carboxymethylaminomethyl(34) synthesis GTPase MnmE [Candidatus Omnitrophica bacterium]|nr:tRNA uridine-5-carboxymethylaminomethyl(34) synthesis GTPase MnmE [Candidatus Omnitrophota bacterium]